MIREAVPDDYLRIQQICEQDLGYACDPELVWARLAHLDKNRECVFAAEIDGEAVGFIHVEKYELLYSESLANILGLAVSGRFRRQGAGKALMKAAEAWAKEHGIMAMRLNSGGSRKEAHAFYRAMGYTNEKEQIRFIKELQ